MNIRKLILYKIETQLHMMDKNIQTQRKSVDTNENSKKIIK